MSAVETIDRQAGWLLTAALLAGGRKQLSVIPPARARAKRILDLSGLSFAFAHANTQFLVHDWDPNEIIGPWRPSWTYRRGAVEQQLPLFARKENKAPSQPELFDSTHPDFRDGTLRLAAFVNPHLTARQGVDISVANAVSGWLHRTVPRLARRRLQFMRSLSAVVDELVVNIADHAFAGPDTRSIVLVNCARGNSAERRYRIHIAVLDNGPGLIATARPKAIKRCPDGELLMALLDGGAINQTGRGLGLPRVAELTLANNGSLRVFSSGHAARLSREARTTSGTPYEGGAVVMLAMDVPSDET